MPDPLPLPAEPTPKSRRGLLVLGLILACAAVWLYGRHAASTIVSRQALVEGRTYSVPAPVTGVVRAVPVVEGQTVKNGELVLLMDDAPLRSALAEAREALAIARQGGCRRRRPTRPRANGGKTPIARPSWNARRKRPPVRRWSTGRRNMPGRC